MGSKLHTAARIEPITRPGEIFVTEAFKIAIHALPDPVQGIEFDLLGQFPLAKNFGKLDLFRLRRSQEKTLDLDRIFSQDISNDLPEPEKIRQTEISAINFIKNAPNTSVFKELIQPHIDRSFEDDTGEFLLKLAELSLNFGAHEIALKLIDKLENWSLPASGALLHPYRNDKRVWELKANALTRIGGYNEAADIVYSLWMMHPGDAEILAMLAGQYKRHALFGDGRVANPREINPDSINHELLIRACNLYVEAFRLDMTAYYPAINAAYLYVSQKGPKTQAGRGNKLAMHIITTWDKFKNHDWWTAATLAEAEVILKDFDTAVERFRYALRTHSPTVYQKEATADQLRIHATLTDTQDEMQSIIDLM